MNYKVGDKVIVKSKQWMNEQLAFNTATCNVYLNGVHHMNKIMQELHSQIVTITSIEDDRYTIKELQGHIWKDWMFECKFELIFNAIIKFGTLKYKVTHNHLASVYDNNDSIFKLLNISDQHKFCNSVTREQSVIGLFPAYYSTNDLTNVTLHIINECFKQNIPVIYNDIKLSSNIKPMQNVHLITQNQFLEIVNIACPDWKEKLLSCYYPKWFPKGIVPEEDVQLMLRAANKSQEELLRSIFEISNKIPKWEDLKELEGYFINSNSEIKHVTSAENNNCNKAIFATEKQAKSALAFAQLTQIINKTNPKFTTNVNKPGNQWQIFYNRNTNRLEVCTNEYVSSILTFASKEIAEKFLYIHADLIRQYYML